MLKMEFDVSGAEVVYSNQKPPPYNPLIRPEMNYKKMIAALVIVTVALTVIALITEKKAVFECVKKGSAESVVCGAGNGLANYLVMVMAGRLPASVMYPIISAGGILGSLLVTVFLYREKLSKNQIAGIILGTLAIVFLNL